MSKQAQEVLSIFKIILPNIQEEVGLEKITNVQLHRGIRVDFYDKDSNLIIEVMGCQHFRPSGFGKSKVDSINAFNRQLNRDSKLIRICKDFNINYEQIDFDQKVDFPSMYKKFSKYLENKDA